MKSIFDTLNDNGNFRTLIRAIEKAGMEDTMRGMGEFTCFAPTDMTFLSMSDKEVDSLLNNRNSAGEMVWNHTMNGKSLAKNFKRSILVLSGRRIKIDRHKGLRIGNALAVQPDIECSNGVIHVIDRMLVTA